MAHGRANLFQRLLANAGNLFQLLRRHVGQRFHRSDACGDQLLQRRLSQLRNLFDRRCDGRAHGLHLLLDLLALLLFALDVNLPAQQFGGQAHILPLLANGQRKLRIIHDDFQLLFAEVGNADAAHLGWLQRLLCKGGDLIAVLDDVNLFPAQLPDDRLHTHSLHAHASAHRVHILIARLNGNLGALARLAGNGANFYGVVVNLRHFAAEEVLHQLLGCARDDDLRPARGAIHTQQHHTHPLADGKLLQARLLPLGHTRLCLAQIKDHILRLVALDGGRQHFVHAVVVLVEYSVALGLAHFLKDDLLGHLRSDAAQNIGRLVVANLLSSLHLFHFGARLIEGNLIEGILDLLRRFHDRLVDIGANLTRLAVQFCAYVFLRLVIFARRQGDGVFHGSNNDLRVNALVAA